MDFLRCAKTFLFYIIFYAVLSGFFGAMLAVFHKTLDMKQPKWQLSESLIGDNPGLSFRPMPPESNVESTLIRYNSSDEGDYRAWSSKLDNFLKDYDERTKVMTYNANKLRITAYCDYYHNPKPGEFCDVDISQWRPCTKENLYNYHKSAPCIFLKLNKIFGWQPKFFNDTENLPSNMPDDMRAHINFIKANRPAGLNTIWISCEGENPADVENMGPIQYIPRRGFPGYYFPFNNTPGYLSPLVAVFFEKPKHGVLINIECKAWAHNILHDRYERRGSVHFKLMVD